MNTLSRFLSSTALLLALSIPQLALASPVADFARMQISGNAKLQQTLSQMGLDVDTAAEKFAEAEAAVEKETGEKANWGRLAICAGAEGRALMFGLGGSICTSLNELFWFGPFGFVGDFSPNKAHLAAGGSATVEAIYFRAADGDYSKSHCYAGLTGIVAAKFAVGGRALMEVKECGHTDTLFEPKGFLIGIRGGVGVGFDFGAQMVGVRHIFSYWD